MASNSNSPKGFLLVECQKPANGRNRVIVPKSWVICTLIPDKMVCIVYPDEEMSRTAERLRNNEPKGEGWRSYIGEIIYEGDWYTAGHSGNRNTKQHVKEGSKSHEAPHTSTTSPDLASQHQEPPASASSSGELVTPAVTPATKARDSLKVKIRRSSYGWQSNKSKIIKKSFKNKLKGHDKDKSNKLQVNNMEKRILKENTENSFLDSVNTPEATEVNQNKPGIEHIMPKRMELKIKDIMHSSEPELNRLTLNKTNSVVSNASLSENIQDCWMLKRNNQDSNMTDDKMQAKENDEDDEELEALIYEENEEKVLF